MAGMAAMAGCATVAWGGGLLGAARRGAVGRGIDALRIRRPDPESVEMGVPHPATYVLDRDGVIRFVDVRKGFHFWLDPLLPLRALAEIP